MSIVLEKIGDQHRINLEKDISSQAEAIKILTGVKGNFYANSLAVLLI